MLPSWLHLYTFRVKLKLHILLCSMTSSSRGKGVGGSGWNVGTMDVGLALCSRNAGVTQSKNITVYCALLKRSSTLSVALHTFLNSKIFYSSFAAKEIFTLDSWVVCAIYQFLTSTRRQQDQEPNNCFNMDVVLLPERMARYIIIWVSCAILLAEGKIECTRGERLLKEFPRDMTWPTQCLMECSVRTYQRKLQVRDNRNIRFNDCTVGESQNNSHIVHAIQLTWAGLFLRWIAYLLIEYHHL